MTLFRSQCFRMALGFVVLTLLLATARTCPAQFAGEEWEVRVYRVTDLILPRPDYPYDGSEIPTTGSSVGGSGVITGVGGGFGGGGFGGGGGSGFFQVTDDSGFAVGSGGLDAVESGIASAGDTDSRFSIDDLIEAIVMTIEPASWAEMGGEAVCTSLGGMLIIKQTPTAHRQIEELLSAIREEGGGAQTVTLQAHWLLLGSAEVRQLVGDSERALTTIDREALQQFAELQTGYQGRITCFSDQTVHLVAGERRSAVVGAIPVVSAMAIGFQPIISLPNIGVLLQVKPTLLPDGETAVLNLVSTVTKTGSATEKVTIVSQSGEEVDTALELDRLSLETQRLATTIRVPLGQPVLVGGLSVVGAESRANADAAQGGQLYLVVELTADTDAE